jgi:cysteine desulfurase
MLTGGGQERGRRSGTENPAGIVGLARALELATEALPEAAPRMARLRDRLQRGLSERVEGLWVTAAETPRTPNTLHLSLADVESEALLTLLDEAGIAVSAGSACSTGSLEPSHVLLAQGLPAERMHGALRFSLSRDTTEDEIGRVLELMPPLVERLRALARGGRA